MSIKNKFNIGDLVIVNEFQHPDGVMTDWMVEKYGGKSLRIRGIILSGTTLTYTLEGALGYLFKECDLALFVPPAEKISVPVPGGRLEAEISGGGSYPGIFISFYASGDSIEHPLCFAEVCAMDNPDVIRIGTYFRDCDDVRDVMEVKMWEKGEQ